MIINPKTNRGVLLWTLAWPIVALAAWLPMLIDALVSLFRGAEIEFYFDMGGKTDAKTEETQGQESESPDAQRDDRERAGSQGGSEGGPSQAQGCTVEDIRKLAETAMEEVEEMKRICRHHASALESHAGHLARLERRTAPQLRRQP